MRHRHLAEQTKEQRAGLVVGNQVQVCGAVRKDVLGSELIKRSCCQIKDRRTSQGAYLLVQLGVCN
jgi:hypothetical protein